MSWDKAIKFVLAYEGSSYENDPNDLGGETKYGISKKAYPNEDIPNMTLERATDIYKMDYWNAVGADYLPEKLAYVVFDCAVNQGVPTAIKLLQVVLDVEVDGKLGPKTLNAAEYSSDQHVWYYLLHRARLYMKTKSVEHWGANWGLRLLKLADLAFEAPVS